MVKRYLQKLQSLRKHGSYVVVFALGAVATGLAYELGGADEAPARPSLARLNPPSEPSPPEPRLVEQMLPPQAEVPKPRFEPVAQPAPSPEPVRPTAATLREAASVGDLARVRELLAERVPIEEPDSRGRTALYIGAMNAQVDVVRVLLEAGANVDARAEDGSTPLLAAAGVGDPVIVHMLLEADANVDARDKSGTTARLLAKKRGHDVVYEFIVDEVQQRQRDKNAVLKVQQLLSKLGYNVGRPDGLMGPQTERAIRKFQSKHRLKVDGKITPQLISTLERRKSADRQGSAGGVQVVRAPMPKPRSAAGIVPAPRSRPTEEAKADDVSDDSGGGWLDRAAEGVGALFSKTQAAADQRQRVCAAATDRWVRDADGNWIECPNVPRY